MSLWSRLSDYLGLTGGVDHNAEIHRLRRENAVLRSQVDELAGSSGVDLRRIPVPSPVSPAVEALVSEGKDIAAIKQHRAETGLGLKEAKDDVDEVRRRLRHGR